MPENDGAPKPKLTPLRMVFAIIGGLLMVFAGGCGLVWLVAFISEFGSVDAPLSGMIALFTLPPIFVGWLIWYIAVKRGR